MTGLRMWGKKDVWLSGPSVREEAEKLVKKMSKPEFKAIEGWCNRWIKPENISYKTLKGEAKDADVATAHSLLKEQWKNSDQCYFLNMH